MTAPADGTAAGPGGYLRASHADRDRVIDGLKAAFVQGRLGQDEFDHRVGQALASRTYAELAALTADLPSRADRRPAAQARQEAGQQGRRRGDGLRNGRGRGFPGRLGVHAGQYAARYCPAVRRDHAHPDLGRADRLAPDPPRLAGKPRQQPGRGRPATGRGRSGTPARSAGQPGQAAATPRPRPGYDGRSGPAPIRPCQAVHRPGVLTRRAPPRPAPANPAQNHGYRAVLDTGQGRRHLGGEELHLGGQAGEALDAAPRPPFHQRRVDQAERDVVITVRGEVTAQALDPCGGITGDVRRPPISGVVSSSASSTSPRPKASTTGRTSA